MQHHKYSLTEIENMMPWERDIYVDMLITWIKEQNEKLKDLDKKIYGIGVLIIVVAGLEKLF